MNIRAFTGSRALLGASMAVILVAASVEPANAQSVFEVSVHTGLQGAPDTRVTGTDELGAPFDFMAGWEGRSLELMVYFGVKVMRWQDNGWGYGLEMTHAKVWADDETRIRSGFARLNFTDGNNVTTVNLARREDISDRLNAYAGIGGGLVMPHLTITSPAGTPTDKYQITGLAGRWFGGLQYELGENWSVFSEYAGTLSAHRARLEQGATLDTDIVTHALNVGLTYTL